LRSTPSEAGVISLDADGNKSVAPLISLMTQVIVSESRLKFFNIFEFSDFLPEINEVRFVGNGDFDIVSTEDIIQVVVLYFAEGDG
jgi:hypothetical protein